ncbi:MAG TPA: heavy metal-associated domain-containing protein [Bacillota bacterium]|nr:heavy metal-associated domain-containing protein [Bacillota bacterium]
MKQIIHIQGMSCMHCQKRVKAALLAHREILRAEVDLSTGTAIVESTRGIDFDSVRKWIDEAGYQALSMEDAGR